MLLKKKIGQSDNVDEEDDGENTRIYGPLLFIRDMREL